MIKTPQKILEDKIDDATYMYTNFGDSGATDAEYDSWIDRLRALDPSNKRLTSVGSTPDANSGWDKFDHTPYLMGSQNKVTDYSTLQKWAALHPGEKLVVEHKLDGTSLKLIYKDGVLKAAITRGKGKFGENIYRNAIKMKGVQKTIPIKGEVVIRAEILLFKSNLVKVGGKNTRNTAAGTAKRHDGTGCEHLNVVCYCIMNWEELGIKTNSDMIAQLKSWKFDTVTFHGPYSSLAEVEKLKNEYETTDRVKLEWDVDGLIVQVDTLKKDKWDFPDRATAYKFAAEEAVTELLGIEWRDTGGRYAPRAILAPVNIGGVTVTHATLNNWRFIEELRIKIGDMVLVSRRNDVIPAIEKVSIASPTGTVIKRPTHDDQGFLLEFEKNSEGEELVYLISTNPNSRAKQIRKIMAWYREHDTKGVASETVDSIISAGCAIDLPTFYDVGINGHDDLINVEGFGVGKFKILNKATLLTSHTDIIKFFGGLDIQGFGSRRFEAILRAHNKRITLKEFEALCLDVAFISNIAGFGQNTAKGLAAGVKENAKIIDAMLSRVKVNIWEPLVVSSTSKIAGKSFCFTGSFSEDRNDLERKVKNAGGLIAGVSKKLDYLVSPSGWSSGKLDKAIALDIKIIDEQEFINILNGDT